MAEFDTLYALAEISVAMAGFAAIVVLFKRSSSGGWSAVDADRFNGMLVHAMGAGFLCILPPFLNVFVPNASVLWQVASVLVAAQLLMHAGVIFSLPSSTFLIRLGLALPLGLVALQGLNVVGIWLVHEFRPYLAAVLWHLFQAGFLFVSLVVVRKAQIDADSEKHAD